MINEIEVKYRRLLKATLGVRKTTCNEIIYIELGRTSISTEVKISQYMFWEKVMKMDEDEPIRKIIKIAKDHNLEFVRYYDELLERYNGVDEIKHEFFTKIKIDIEIKARNGRSRYSTYKIINPNLEHPTIYNSLKTQHDLEMVARLRTGTHQLRIETGRVSRTPREQRLCSCGEIEDEEHFLVRCTNYEE